MSPEKKAGGNIVAATGEGNILSTGDVVFPQVWNEQGTPRSTCRNWQTTW